MTNKYDDNLDINGLSKLTAAEYDRLKKIAEREVEWRIALTHQSESNAEAIEDIKSSIKDLGKSIDEHCKLTNGRIKDLETKFDNEKLSGTIERKWLKIYIGMIFTITIGFGGWLFAHVNSVNTSKMTNTDSFKKYNNVYKQ